MKYQTTKDNPAERALTTRPHENRQGGMLILTRKVGQSLLIMPARTTDPATPVGELFQTGPLEISFEIISGARVKLGVAADRRLLVLRKELYKG